MLVVFSYVVPVAVMLFLLHRIIRPFLKVRSLDDFSRALNRQNGTLQHSLAISEIGAKAAPRESFDSSRHGATIGVKLLATVVAPLLFFLGNTTLLDAAGRAIDASTASWLGFALLLIAAWYLLFIWTYSVEITHDTLSVPTFLIVRRKLPLAEIERMTDTGDHFLRLRFRGGRRTQVLKYVAGRDALVQRLSQHVPGHTEPPASGKSCQNSPKSKPSALGFFR